MNPTDVFPLRGLYAISDGPRGDLLDACAAALDGGAAILQYRDKTTDRERRSYEARALQALCARYRVPLIINDDIELAARVSAAGVHLGEDDGAIASARARLGAEAIIGASCYDSLDRAHAMAAAGADYLAFGAFFPSPTKPFADTRAKDRPSTGGFSNFARHAKLQLLSDAQPLGLPLVAIGGITVDNARSLIDAGADAVAVISALFGVRDVRAAARSFVALFEAARS